MAIVLAVKKWRPHLSGRHFIIRTNKKSPSFLWEQQLVSEDNKKWMSKLLGYDFEIQYRPGLENKAADALSRLSNAPVLVALFMPMVLNLEELQQQVELECLSKIKAYLQTNRAAHPGFSLQQGRLLLEWTNCDPLRLSLHSIVIKLNNT